MADAAVTAEAAWSPLDRLLAEPVSADRLPGAVVAVWRGGERVHEAAFGAADVASGNAMRADTIFRLYSMTKPVTAAALMVLWDEGGWHFDDPVADYLPELAALQLADGTPARPTVGQLLTNTAGFAYGLGDDVADRQLLAAGVPPFPHGIAPDDYLARIASLPLAYPPGAAWRYSVAADLQGLLVERIGGVDLRTFVRERIAEPLGMVDTDFVVPPDKADRLATLYLPAGDALIPLAGGPAAPDAATPPLMASGGAGLFSTVADYGRFARMLHGGGTLAGTRVLSEAAVAEMRRPRLTPALLAGGFGTAPHWLRPGYDYCYNGVVVTDPPAAGVALGRGTYFWDGAAGSWFWSDPESDTVMICMTHLLADAERLGLQFAARGVVADIIEGEQG